MLRFWFTFGLPFNNLRLKAPFSKGLSSQPEELSILWIVNWNYQLIPHNLWWLEVRVCCLSVWFSVYSCNSSTYFSGKKTKKKDEKGLAKANFHLEVKRWDVFGCSCWAFWIRSCHFWIINVPYSMKNWGNTFEFVQESTCFD